MNLLNVPKGISFKPSVRNLYVVSTMACCTAGEEMLAATIFQSVRPQVNAEPSCTSQHSHSISFRPEILQH